MVSTQGVKMNEFLLKILGKLTNAKEINFKIDTDKDNLPAIKVSIALGETVDEIINLIRKDKK